MNTLVRRGPPGHFWVLLAIAALAPSARAQAPVVPDDVNSREISIFTVGQLGPVDPDDVNSREVSIFVAIPLSPVDPNDVNSREISLLVTPPPSGIDPDDVNSREISVFIPPPGLLVDPEDTITREYSIYIQPYTVTDVASALRIAAGLHAATPDEASRLDSEGGGVPHRVELVDALGIMRRAMGLTP